jgi:protein-arginine kinase activator protein McsA
MMRVKKEVGSDEEEISFLRFKIEEVNNLIDQAVEEEEYELASNLKIVREELKTKLNNLTK